MSGGARYIDKDGDVWKDQGSGSATCVVRHGETIENGLTITFARLIERYGPISLAPSAADHLRSHVRDVIAEWLPGSRDYGHVQVAETGESLRVKVSPERYEPGTVYEISVSVSEVEV